VHEGISVEGQQPEEGDERSATPRNPSWLRDELILALDLYFRQSPQIGDATHPEVIALSNILNALPLHAVRPDARRFRNPAGVAMKLNNFRGLDPTYHGTGLSHGAKADKVIWDEFAHDRERLYAVAAAIRDFATAPKALLPDLDGEECGAVEGEVLLREHRMRERDRGLVSKKKQQVLTRDSSPAGRDAICACSTYLRSCIGTWLALLLSLDRSVSLRASDKTSRDVYRVTIVRLVEERLNLAYGAVNTLVTCFSS
jgi:hypothetical protein